MLRRTEREVYKYDLAVRSRARHAALPDVLELMRAIEAYSNDPAAKLERDRGSLIYRVGQIVIDEQAQLATLLIRRGDVHASNAVYSNRHTGEPRVIPKADDEAGDKAAHLVVSLTPENPNRYLAHLEGVPGLSHRLVQATLNKIIALSIPAGGASLTTRTQQVRWTEWGIPSSCHTFPSSS